jgi:hypothetical protein
MKYKSFSKAFLPKEQQQQQQQQQSRAKQGRSKLLTFCSVPVVKTSNNKDRTKFNNFINKTT